MKGKKGNAGIVWGLTGAVIAFVVLVVATTLTAQIGSDIRTSQCAVVENGVCGTDLNTTTRAYNVSTQGLEGLSNLSGQFTNIGTILAVGALIAILIAAFAYLRMR